MTDELVKLSAAQMAAKIKSGEVSSRELVEAHLKVIEAAEPSIQAFLQVSADEARAQADAFDEKTAKGQTEGLPELAGVPIAIKDMIVTKGIVTTAASKILEGWVPPYDATVIEKLKAVGMPLLGKTNLDEFAQGSSTEHSAFGPTHNPWDTDRVPGGSGGGSASAVAAFEAPLALGTDTGGSIRQPGALTGTVGVKPTYGGVSRFGAIAMASSLDQIGPVSRTVLDSALLQEIIGGHDRRDSTSIPAPVRPMAAAAREGMKRDLKGMRIGLVKELGGEGFQPGVQARFNESVKLLEEMGAPEHRLGTRWIALTAQTLAAGPEGMLLKEAYYPAIQRSRSSYGAVDKNIRDVLQTIHAAATPRYQALMGGLPSRCPSSKAFLLRLARELQEGRAE